METNKDLLQSFFSFEAIYNYGFGQNLESILSAITENKKYSFCEFWQFSNRSGYVCIFDGLPVNQNGNNKQIRFAISIESHSDFKEITIHNTDFLKFCNNLIFFNQKKTWFEYGYEIDTNYLIHVYSYFIYDLKEYSVIII